MLKMRRSSELTQFYNENQSGKLLCYLAQIDLLRDDAQDNRKFSSEEIEKLHNFIITKKQMLYLDISWSNCSICFEKIVFYVK